MYKITFAAILLSSLPALSALAAETSLGLVEAVEIIQDFSAEGCESSFVASPSRGTSERQGRSYLREASCALSGLALGESDVVMKSNIEGLSHTFSTGFLPGDQITLSLGLSSKGYRLSFKQTGTSSPARLKFSEVKKYLTSFEKKLSGKPLRLLVYRVKSES